MDIIVCFIKAGVGREEKEDVTGHEVMPSKMMKGFFLNKGGMYYCCM